jgi:hypothetical protein
MAIQDGNLVNEESVSTAAPRLPNCDPDESMISTIKDCLPSLGFHIPKDAFESTKNIGTGVPEGYWSHSLYVGSDASKVKVHYCKSKGTSERVLQRYFANQASLGFDVEWKTDARRGTGLKGIRENVSLVQLACEDRIALFHLALFTGTTVDDLVPPTLKQIMEDVRVNKAGVSICGDCTRLRNNLAIDSQGLIELSHLHKLVKYSPSADDEGARDGGRPGLINRRPVSLAVQVEEHLGLPLYKGDVVRGSDWSQALGMDQISYAASDSYAGFMLYKVLEQKRCALVPAPPRPYHAELGLPIRLAAGVEIPPVDETAASEPSIPEPNEPVLFKRSRSRDGNSSDTSARTPEFHAADAWARTYRQAHPHSAYAHTPARQPAAPSQLRAYALWRAHEADGCRALADHLRVKEVTVALYIAEAVRLERLPFDPARLSQVLASVPEALRANVRLRIVARLIADGEHAGRPWTD